MTFWGCFLTIMSKTGPDGPQTITPRVHTRQCNQVWWLRWPVTSTTVMANNLRCTPGRLRELFLLTAAGKRTKHWGMGYHSISCGISHHQYHHDERTSDQLISGDATNWYEGCQKQWIKAGSDRGEGCGYLQGRMRAVQGCQEAR